MSYDVSLLTGAQLVEQTGVQDLANLAADSELVLNTFALNAHRAVYRRLQARGIDPTLITNEDQLKDAVAYEAVGRLALAGYLGSVDAQAMLQLAKDAAGQDWRPTYASADSPRHGGESVPAVGHVEDALFSTFTEDTPSVT